MMKHKHVGFTLVELLVGIGVIVIVGSIVFLSLSRTSSGAQDDVRIAELGRLGQWLSAAGQGIGNYLPADLPAEGDLNILIDEVEEKAGLKVFGSRPKDPSATGGETGFRYVIDGGDIVIYANLAVSDTEITLPYGGPTPGGGAGVFRGTVGWNGTDKYYQVTN